MKVDDFKTGDRDAEGWVATDYWVGNKRLFTRGGETKEVSGHLIPESSFGVLETGEFFVWESTPFFKFGSGVAWSFADRKAVKFRPGIVIEAMDWEVVGKIDNYNVRWDKNRVEVDLDHQGPWSDI